MKTAIIHGYALEYDAAATAAAYAAMPMPFPEKCTCWYCRNWIAGRDELLPPDVRHLLRDFGVPSDGEIEVWEVPGEAATPHWYGGWYTVVGKLHILPAESERDFRLGSWKLSFSPGQSHPVAALSNLEVFEMHFFVEGRAFIRPDALESGG